MKLLRHRLRPAHVFFLALAFFSVAGTTAYAAWQRDATAFAWRNDTGIVWRFSFDPAAGKPYFHPLTVDGGPSLTNFKPGDHPWHYGLWFSWKYINGVNYWEESPATGRAEGVTRWTQPEIEIDAAGNATLQLALSYVNPAGEIVLTETRDLHLSAPAADGSYAIDWHARFTVGAAAIVLDRTPMPGEPNGQVNGGYAGLGTRLASPPLRYAAISTAGPVAKFENERARPAAPAIALNFSDEASSVGSLAILSDPANAGENAPWYLVDSAQMRFACAAILAPKPLRYPAGAHFELRYRLALRRAAWTTATLQAACDAWRSNLLASATSPDAR